MAHATLASPISAPLFCLQLQPGCRVWEYLPRAADITVAEGSIVVHQRVVLAGAWVHLPVVVRAVLDAEDRANAMELRAFGTTKRTWVQQLQFRVRDFVMISAGSLTLAGAIVMRAVLG